MKKLAVPLRGKVTLGTKLRAAADGKLKNGFLVLGDGAEDTNLVKCGLRFAMKKAVIVEGPFSDGKVSQEAFDPDETKVYDLTVSIDLVSGQVTLKAGGATVTAKLEHPPAALTHVGDAPATRIRIRPVLRSQHASVSLVSYRLFAYAAAICRVHQRDATIPPAVSDPAVPAGEVSAPRGKPIACAFMGAADVAAGIHILQRASIPHYLLPEWACRAMSGVARIRAAREEPLDEPERVPVAQEAAPHSGHRRRRGIFQKTVLSTCWPRTVCPSLAAAYVRRPPKR